MAEYLDKDGLIYYNTLIKQKIDAKANTSSLATVATSGKYSDLTEKYELPIASASVLGGIKVGTNLSIDANGVLSATAQPITVDSVLDENSTNAIQNKPVATAISSLGASILDLPTETDVQEMIDDAIKGLEGVEFEVVQTLPATGDSGKIYLVPNSGSGDNVYDEYIWLKNQSKFEKIGSTNVDLSQYWAKADLVAIQNSEIDTIVEG